MKSPAMIIEYLRGRGVTLSIFGGKLKYYSRFEPLSAEDADLIKAHKSEVVTYLHASAFAGVTELCRVVADRSAPLELSFAQQRLWFLAQLVGFSEAYHIPLGLRLHGNLNEVALRRALDRVVARHEALRTTFVTENGRPFQKIAAEDRGLELLSHNLEATRDAEEQLGVLMRSEATAPFDMANGPLIRGRLIRLAPEDHVLLLTMHHIVSDGWSMGILADELSVLYGAFSRDEPDPLKPLAIQYADYAAWQRQWLSGDVLSAQSAYWRKTLMDAPALLELPTDRRRPAQKDHSGAFVHLELDEELTAGLKTLSQKQGTTLFMTVLAAWALVLSRLSGQLDVVIGTPTANRMRSEVEGLIGFFVNTLALRIDLSGSPSVEELLQRTKTAALGAQEHQDLPFEQVVEIIQPARSLAYTPIFQVMFSWHNSHNSSINLLDIDAAQLLAPYSVAQFDLLLNVAENDGGLLCNLSYSTSLFNRSTAERFVAYLQIILEEMSADPTNVTSTLPILPRDEQFQLLESWNATEMDYPKELCIHQLFEEQVALNGPATAVTFEDKTLSYAALNDRANQLGHHLIALGLKPDDRVAICMRRCPEMIVGLMAVLKAGGAYVPLDPAYPTDRLTFLLNDCQAQILLTNSDLEGDLPPFWGHTLLLDIEEKAINQLPTNNVCSNVIPKNIAYVIYTSGSTGTPKGVMVEHAQVVNYLIWAISYYELSPNICASVNTPFAFDATVTSLLAPLTAGGGILLLREDASEFVRFAELFIDSFSLSLAKLTPSHLDLIHRLRPNLSHDNKKRTIVIGGEALKAGQINAWRGPNASIRLINEYGPTEATVGVLVYEVCDDATYQDNIPIGRPISNARIYILDGHCEPVPLGVVGEIYIGGAGVARGYLNRPELTAERFISSPFVQGDRLYKTGDLARYLPDGNIEFLGRNDFQVKIRGFRIELGEIEARLLEHPCVREAVVIAREDSPGDRRLAAYYTGTHEADAVTLRAHLTRVVPDYMVPATFVRIEALPLTPNGKLDRKALPAPGDEAYVRQAYEAPQGEIEEALAAIWCELLGVDQVSRYDNFFELGGHSLLAVKALEWMRRKGIQVDIRILFSSQSLHELAQFADIVRQTPPPLPNLMPEDCSQITPDLLSLIKLNQSDIDEIAKMVPGGAKNIQDIYPLIPIQEGILLHHVIAKKRDPYVVCSSLAFTTRERLNAFINAYQAAIDRHDILRTSIIWENVSEPVQVVWRKAPLIVNELSLDPRDGSISEQLMERFRTREIHLDVRRAPMLQLQVAYDQEKCHWVGLMLHHHLIDDNASLKILMSDIGRHLSGFVDNSSTPVPFRNFVATRLAANKTSGDAEFFRKMLEDICEPSAPYGILDIFGDGDEIEEAHLKIESALCSSINDWARRLKVSVASFIHLAWGQVIASVTGEPNPVFGTILVGRIQAGPGSDRAVGLFINMLPIRLRLGCRLEEEQIRETHTILAELMQHQYTPLRVALRSSRVPPYKPLFNSLLNYRHNAITESDANEFRNRWDGIRYMSFQERTNFPIAIFVDNLGDSIIINIQTSHLTNPQRLCREMVRKLENIIASLETDKIITNNYVGFERDLERLEGAGPSDVINASLDKFDAPQGAMECFLASVWKELLRLDRVGRNHNFIDLGGTSLLVLKVVSSCQKHGLVLSPRGLLNARNLAEAASIIEPLSSFVEK